MAINYVKHDEEFHGVFKLVSGEEVLAKAVMTTEDNCEESLAFLQDPVCIQPINQDLGKGKIMRGLGFHRWMMLSDEEFFIIREKDILSVASMSKHIIGMYEKFLIDEYADRKDDGETQEIKDKRTARRKTDIDNTQGFIGKINQARQSFEKLYKS
tara:strand:- start:307 stop:774 length:468 start_codon:yes stop_codon:yes gene_type:complete